MLYRCLSQFAPYATEKLFQHSTAQWWSRLPGDIFIFLISSYIVLLLCHTYMIVLVCVCVTF